MPLQSNPAAPSLAGSLYGLTQFNGGSDVAVVGDKAYVVTVYDYLSIVGVSDPANMVHLGSIQESTHLNFAQSIVATSSYAYVAARFNSGIAVVDVSNSASPRYAIPHATPPAFRCRRVVCTNDENLPFIAREIKRPLTR